MPPTSFDSRINGPVVLDMMVTYLGADPNKFQQKINDTKGCHARFLFLVKLYKEHLAAVKDVAGDDARVACHKAYALMSYFMVLVGTCIFMDKSVTYEDIFYINSFIDLEKIHEYNWRTTGLV